MQECIDKLSGAKTPTLLLNTLNYKWSLLLDLSPPVFEKDSSFNQLPACLISAIRHQNLIGWQTMLWGFTTWYWLQAYLTLCDFLQESPNPSWDVLITSTSIHYLYKNILDNRNKFLHGSTKSDQQQKLHLRVIQQVQAIYSNPLCLHHWYPRIHKVPLQEHVARPTRQFIHWLSHINHQKQLSQTLQGNSESTQLSIRGFMIPLMPSEGVILAKFPP